jgi:hypothetical protein
MQCCLNRFRLSSVRLGTASGREPIRTHINSTGATGFGNARSRLLELLPGVVDEKADDSNSDETGRSAEEADEGGQTVYFANDLVLLVLFVGVSSVEEELVLFVAGDLPTVGEQKKEGYSDHCPDD